MERRAKTKLKNSNRKEMHRLFILLCLSSSGVRSQNVQKIENLVKNFAHDEKRLWQLVNHGDNNTTRINDVNKVLEFYEIYMGMDFGEIGIFQIISKDWLNDNYDGLELMKHMRIVNITFEVALSLVKTRNYAHIIKFVTEIPEVVLTDSTSFILGHLRDKLWRSMQQVKLKFLMLSQPHFLEFDKRAF